MKRASFMGRCTPIASEHDWPLTHIIQRPEHRDVAICAFNYLIDVVGAATQNYLESIFNIFFLSRGSNRMFISTAGGEGSNSLWRFGYC